MDINTCHSCSFNQVIIENVNKALESIFATVKLKNATDCTLKLQITRFRIQNYNNVILLL